MAGGTSISRAKTLVTVAATNSSSTSAPIDFGAYAGGVFLAPASVTSVAFYVSDSAVAGGNVSVLASSSNAAVTRTVTAGQWYALPDECFGARYVVMVLTGSSAATVSLYLAT